jgi:hypothetical protein
MERFNPKNLNEVKGKGLHLVEVRMGTSETCIEE